MHNYNEAVKLSMIYPLGQHTRLQYVSIKSLRLMIVQRSLDGASVSVSLQTDCVKTETERNKVMNSTER